MRSRGDRVPSIVVIGLSGLTALACEVLWTRLLSLLFGATTYTFSLILAVFLAGLGIGSSVGSALGAERSSGPRVALGLVSARLCARRWRGRRTCSRESLPYWPINPSIAPNPWFQFQLDLVRCLFAVLPGAILWGASFPLALASVASDDEDPARLVGGVYAANTLGAIVGSLDREPVLIVWLGTQHAQQVLIVVAALSGLMLLAEAQAADRRASSSPARSPALHGADACSRFPACSSPTAATPRRSSDRPKSSTCGEGWNASVAVSERSNGVRNYHNAGKVQASSEPQDMRLQRMLGHLTTLVPKQREDGRGHRLRRRRHRRRRVDRSGRRARDDRRDRAARAARGLHLLRRAQLRRRPQSRRSRVHIDDARHFLFTTKEKFDAITSDPLDPWVKGAAMLYTREFFELAKSRLNPGGIVTLFVQLYESNTEAVKSEIATFFEAFPEGDDLRQHLQRRRLRPRAARPGRRHDDQPRRDGGAAQAARVRAGAQVARARSACTRRSICLRPTPGPPRT